MLSIPFADSNSAQTPRDSLTYMVHYFLLMRRIEQSEQRKDDAEFWKAQLTYRGEG